MQYIPQNLIKNKNIMKINISIKNIIYNYFVNILGKNIGYNKMFEFIFYKFIKIKRFEINI